MGLPLKLFWRGHHLPSHLGFYLGNPGIGFHTRCGFLQNGKKGPSRTDRPMFCPFFGIVPKTQPPNWASPVISLKPNPQIGLPPGFPRGFPRFLRRPKTSQKATAAPAPPAPRGAGARREPPDASSGEPPRPVWSPQQKISHRAVDEVMGAVFGPKGGLIRDLLCFFQPTGSFDQGGGFAVFGPPKVVWFPTKPRIFLVLSVYI